MMITKKVGLAISSCAFVLGLALSSFAAREVVTGSVISVDAMKGAIVLKTETGPREFNSRSPEKLKDIKPGEKVSLTIAEDGSLTVEKAR
jgi:hypothetical protein